MKYYQIVTDEEKLRAFVDWLPDLQKGEVFYLHLLARAKYLRDLEDMPNLKGKGSITSLICRKEDIIREIKKLEVQHGLYTSGENIVPQEALALYMTINPRGVLKAREKILNKLLSLSLSGEMFLPHQECLSIIQRSKSRSEFVSFDFDVDKELFPIVSKEVGETLNKEAIHWVETRGGYHLVIRVKDIDRNLRNSWYKEVRELLLKYSSDTDMVGDVMLPVVGTYQGGFTPKFI